MTSPFDGTLDGILIIDLIEEEGERVTMNARPSGRRTSFDPPPT